MKNRINLPTLLILLMCVALAACDGGISGTGAPLPNSGDDDDLIDGGPDGENAAPDGTPSESQDPLDTIFTNNLDVTLRDDALIKFINATSDSNESYVVTNSGNTANPIRGLPGISFEDGVYGYRVLLADTHDIDFVPATTYATDINADKAAGVNPMTLSEGSATTVIVRGSAQLTEAPVSALAVTTKFSTNNFNTIQIRVINAAAHFGQEGNIDIYINQAGQNPTGGLAAFTNFSYEAGNSGYIEYPVGTYNITATGTGGQTQRIPTLDAITPSGASSTTLIIRDDPDGVAGVDTLVMIINDGDTSALQ